jgi:hypothetical protein
MTGDCSREPARGGGGGVTAEPAHRLEARGTLQERGRKE